jgi:hypothetical protein
MSTRDHEGRINPDPSVVTRDSDGSYGARLKAVMQNLLDKLSDSDFAEFMMKFGGNFGGGDALGADEPPPFKGMPKPGGTMVGDAQLRKRVTDAQDRNLKAFKESIGDDRTMRVLNGQLGNA